MTPTGTPYRAPYKNRRDWQRLVMFALSEAWRAVEHHPVYTGTTAGLAAWLSVVWQQAKGHAHERCREIRVREEVEAYAYLDARLSPRQDLATLSRRVCLLITERSLFQRVAMMARNPEGRLCVSSSAAMDDALVETLNLWAGLITEPVYGETATGIGATGASIDLRDTLGRGIYVGRKSLALLLGEIGRIIVIPIATTGERRLMGAIVICATRLHNVRRQLVDEAIAPLETLSVKLGRAMENAALAERLMRAEKLAGLGLLAGGVAHALNNPLTAVLGFAELIADTAEQPHVQEDAETIKREAQRMRDTVESLLNLWRPSIHRDEAVPMTGLVRELAAACEAKLASRGVRLIVQASDDVPPVRGNRDRLRQVMEHLLNNAAQAIATKPAREHSIRITLSHNVRAVQFIVSDTGPGFREPSRVFDPFYTTREPGEGAGLGLSICYGIVREHNGDITAFNLHPHGAAVMVELPIGRPEAVAPEAFIGEVA